MQFGCLIIHTILFRKQTEVRTVIVYGEILFLENLITGGVILYLTAVIVRSSLLSRAGLLRLVFGSVLCGAFSFLLFVPVPAPGGIAAEGGFAVFVCLVVFGRRRLFLRAVVFVTLSCLLGGMTMALLLAFGHTGWYVPGGIYTGNMKVGVLALFLGAAVFAARRMITVVDQVKFYREHVVTVRIRIGAWEQNVQAFWDTGNCLRDPAGGKAVAVCSAALWERIEKEGVLLPERFRMIPYSAVGGSGLLEAVRTDFIEVDGRCLKGVLLARAGKEFRLVDAWAAEQDVPCLLLSREMMHR